MSEQELLVRRHLKVLLLHLAYKSDEPAQALHSLITEVVDELHDEVEKVIRTRPALKLVAGGVEGGA